MRNPIEDARLCEGADYYVDVYSKGAPLWEDGWARNDLSSTATRCRPLASKLRYRRQEDLKLEARATLL